MLHMPEQRDIPTLSRDKRASLSSGLLGLRGAAPGTEDGTSSAAIAASSDTAKAEARAKSLYTKGAASAAGFRPNQWSFGAPGIAPTAVPGAERCRGSLCRSAGEQGHRSVMEWTISRHRGHQS